jgi:uncharacterized protein YjdB
VGGLVAACEGDDTTAPRANLSGAGNGPNGKNATVRVTPEIDTANALYDTLQLTANVPVTWSSLDPSVAIVDPSGQVVVIGPGLGLIQAIAGRKADTAEVLVRQITASVQLTPDTITVAPEEIGTLTAVAADSNGFAIADALVTWVSDATAVATVVDGEVTGVSEGTTTVRAGVGSVSDTAVVKVEIPATPYP